MGRGQGSRASWGEAAVSESEPSLLLGRAGSQRTWDSHRGDPAPPPSGSCVIGSAQTSGMPMRSSRLSSKLCSPSHGVREPGAPPTRSSPIPVPESPRLWGAGSCSCRRYCYEEVHSAWWPPWVHPHDCGVLALPLGIPWASPRHWGPVSIWTLGHVPRVHSGPAEARAGLRVRLLRSGKITGSGNPPVGRKQSLQPRTQAWPQSTASPGLPCPSGLEDYTDLCAWCP